MNVMIGRLTLFACLSLASLNSFAQYPEGGLKVGMNWATQSVTGSTTTGIQSFHAGLYYFSHVSGILHLQEEISYSGQGFDFMYNNAQVNVSLAYLNIPILARFNIGKRFHLEGGPQINILLSSEVKAANQSINDLITYTAANLGIAVGGGINLPANLGLTVRYFSDLTDADSLQNLESKNKVFQVSITYSLFKRSD